jgi:hypothetical protein
MDTGIFFQGENGEEFDIDSLVTFIADKEFRLTVVSDFILVESEQSHRRMFPSKSEMHLTMAPFLPNRIILQYNPVLYNGRNAFLKINNIKFYLYATQFGLLIERSGFQKINYEAISDTSVKIIA